MSFSLVMEILKYQELGCMLGNKHISLDNDQNRDKTCYYRKKTLEYGRA